MKLKALSPATRLMNLKQLSVKPPRLRLLRASQLRRERHRKPRIKRIALKRRKTKSSAR